MKFNCGPSRAVLRAREEKRKETWHRKFAWLPLRVEPEKCIWLQWYETQPEWVEWEYTQSLTWDENVRGPMSKVITYNALSGGMEYRSYD